MKVSEVYPSNFITAGDLEGKELRITIDRVADKGTVRREDKTAIDKAVVYFKGSPKGFIIGPTNARSIRMALGINEMSDWPGKQIAIYPTTTKISLGMAEQNGCPILEINGKMATVPCIRVKVPTLGGVK